MLQLNKRNIAQRHVIVADLTQQLQKKGEPVIEGVAINGQGVFDTLKELARLVLAELKKGSWNTSPSRWILQFTFCVRSSQATPFTFRR